MKKCEIEETPKVTKDKLPTTVRFALAALTLYGVKEKDRAWDGPEPETITLTTKQFNKFIKDKKAEIRKEYDIKEDDLGKEARISTKILGDFFYKKHLVITD